MCAPLPDPPSIDCRRPARTGPARRLTAAERPTSLEVRIDRDAGRVLVCDGSEVVGYELQLRAGPGVGSGLGFVEHLRGPDGVVMRTAVCAAEVMAVARDAGRECDVADLALGLALLFAAADDERCRELAARLRGEVAAGYELQRVSVRRVAARIRELVAGGESLTDLCRRGGFVTPSGRVDPSWLERRAGLRPERCSKTGKVRRARTATYPVYCQLVRAVDATPEEFGV